MILYEYEGKRLLAAAGMRVPESVHATSADSIPEGVSFPTMVKAQVASGHRAHHGGIVRVESAPELRTVVHDMLARTVSGEQVTSVLIEQFVPHSQEYYLALSYDGTRRTPVLIYGTEGGTGVEGRTQTICALDPEHPQIPEHTPFPSHLLTALIKLFLHGDCLLLEINPLVVTPDGQWYALDAKVHLDDTAQFRHPEWNYADRTPGRTPSERERVARAIDATDHRGTAGASYIDLDGDIALLASGGGASLLALDALYRAGGKPANYVEYSGNPPREKVEALAKVVLSKPGIKGLWIVGAVANFTDIYETLRGVVDGIDAVEIQRGQKFDIPIVIRRGGPRDNEAFEMLRARNDTRLHLMGPEHSIQMSAHEVVRLSYTP